MLFLVVVVVVAVAAVNKENGFPAPLRAILMIVMMVIGW